MILLMTHLDGNGFESFFWVVVQETNWCSNVLRYTLNCVRGNPIHYCIVYYVDISRLGRAENTFK